MNRRVLIIDGHPDPAPNAIFDESGVFDSEIVFGGILRPFVAFRPAPELAPRGNAALSAILRMGHSLPGV
jgi:hypothetical protein